MSNRRVRSILLVVVAAALAVILAACSSPAPTTAPKPTPAPTLTTAPAPTASPKPTATPTPTPVPAPKVTYPQRLFASTYDVTSGTTMQLIAAAPAFKQVVGTEVKIVPSAIRMSQLLAMKMGKTDFWYAGMNGQWPAAAAQEEYAAFEWGPQKLRNAWKGTPGGVGIVVKGNSDIKTLADLKGKKFAIYPGVVINMGSMLAFAGLTVNDLVQVPAGSYAAGMDFLIQGRADAAFSGVFSGKLQEAAMAAGSIRALEMPASDKEGWQRALRSNPSYTPYIVPQGFGPKEIWGKSMVATAYGAVVYAEQNDMVPYTIAKVFAEGYNLYKGTIAGFETSTLQNAVDCLNEPLPYHPGAIKYFKEKGLWTPQHEKWQTDRLKWEEARLEAWGKAVADAEAQKVKVDPTNQKWLDIWYSYLGKTSP